MNISRLLVSISLLSLNQGYGDGGRFPLPADFVAISTPFLSSFAVHVWLQLKISK
jgi:hypothetical protein